MIEVQDRITDRVNRARLELEARRSVRPLVITAVGVVVAIACAFYVVKNVGDSLYVSSRTIQFQVTDAAGVIGGNRQDLTVKGIPAGAISKVDLEGGTAIITASLKKDLGHLYRDGHATLRPGSALQDMSIDIVDRGTPAAGEVRKGSPLPLANTDVSVHAEEVLNSFQPAVRAHLSDVLRNLGSGLGARGDDLRAAFVQLAPFVHTAGAVTGQLRRQSPLTRQLVHQPSVLTGELGRRQQALNELVQKGGTTLRTLESGSPDLDATLTELPPVLEGIDSSFTAVRGVLPSLDTALTRLRPAAQKLPGGLAALRSLADVALPAVKALRPPVADLVPLSRQLRPAATSLRASINDLRPQAPALEYVTKSVAGCSAALQGFFQWTPSVTKFDDATGPAIRGDFAFGVDNTSFAKDPQSSASPSCAPGAPVTSSPGPGGDLKP
jgi:ABC-type transporter Mla subunit MlaD